MTTRRYEILLVLNTKGKEETANDMVDAIEKHIKSAKVEVEQVQRLENRQFAYLSQKETSGYYVNFIVAATTAQIDELRTAWKLDTSIHLQHYQKLKPVAQAA